MKKVLIYVMALLMCLSVSLFTVACAKKSENDDTSEETVIDFDKEGNYADCFSIETTYNTEPIKKTRKTILGGNFINYTSTGTVTVKIEPLTTSRLIAEDVSCTLKISLKSGNEHPNEYWKFSFGGDKSTNYQSKSISVNISQNGTTTVTENIELDFIFDPFSTLSLTFNEDKLNLSPFSSSSQWHGKVHITKN